MAARSAESRRINPLRAVPPGYKLVRADYPEHVPTSDDYPAVILARTRTQLDLVGRQITTELEREKPDSRRLRDLTDAQTRLAEQERVLSGRPLPGSRRPKEDRRQGERGGWIELQPALPGSPQLPKDGSPDLLPVEPPTPAPTAPPTPRSAPSVAPVPIEVALRHRPAPLPTPTSPAPPSQKPG